MAPTIRVDDEVFKALQARAEAFVDSPNEVLRRLLGLDSGRGGRLGERRGTRPRLAPGSATPKEEFRMPILKVLVGLGGKGAPSDVLKGVEAMLGDRLTELDRKPLHSGAIRWEKRANWERFSMKGQGLVAGPPGTWELTELGWREARRSRADGA